MTEAERQNAYQIFRVSLLEKLKRGPVTYPSSAHSALRRVIRGMAADGLVTFLPSGGKRPLVVLGQDEFGEPPPGHAGYELPWLVHWNAGARRASDVLLKTWTLSDAEERAEHDGYAPDCADIEAARMAFMNGFRKVFW